MRDVNYEIVRQARGCFCGLVGNEFAGFLLWRGILVIATSHGNRYPSLAPSTRPSATWSKRRWGFLEWGVPGKDDIFFPSTDMDILPVILVPAKLVTS
ncbi:hypothetical protein WAI453_003551 [Rhynchosporium graminicola]